MPHITAFVNEILHGTAPLHVPDKMDLELSTLLEDHMMALKHAKGSHESRLTSQNVLWSQYWLGKKLIEIAIEWKDNLPLGESPTQSHLRISRELGIQTIGKELSEIFTKSRRVFILFRSIGAGYINRVESSSWKRIGRFTLNEIKVIITRMNAMHKSSSAERLVFEQYIGYA